MAKTYGDLILIFDDATLSTDADGDQVWTGPHVAFKREKGDPYPRSADEAVAILKKHVKGEPALLAILDKPRVGTPSQKALAAVREMVAHPKAAKWKAERDYYSGNRPVKAKAPKGVQK